MHLGWRRLSRTARVIFAGVTGVALSSAPISFSAPAFAAAKATGTVISTRPGPFGPMLIVGSGKYAGYSLYLVTSDQPPDYGCTATIIKTLPGGPGSCTGPSNDQKAEWPAITTDGPPVAGAGVAQSLLGVVTRAGIGVQVTYAGHPLYLFDQQPAQVTGEGWDEPTLPPWHGLWWLVSPTGAPSAWAGTLTTTHIGGKAVLAALMFTGIGWEPFPVYSYTKDSASASTCTGPCAAAWPPDLTSGRAGLVGSVTAAEVSSIKRADGTTQLTYKGKPLYLYGAEGIGLVGGMFEATGDGNGVKVEGGTFQLVSP
jgi:predicted lipoprotein with Yx(FWY)xxD motif